jgi:perosamine synthetase
MNIIQVAKPYFPKEDRETILQDIQSVFDSGMFMQGKFVKEFEKEFAEYVGTRYAVAVNSGTSALQGILNYLNVQDSEVLVPVNTFLATANAVIFEGGIPVFVEMNPQTLCVETADLEKRITSKTKGVIMVPLAGLIPPNMDEISEMCKKHNLFFVEDASHAQGSTYKGKGAGSMGIAGAFSLLATKVMTSGGEGGMVTTDNEELAKRIVSLRFHGEDYARGIQDRIGHSWRMTEIQAICGLTQVRRLKEIVEMRMEIARKYDKAFEELSTVSVVKVPDGDENAYYKYPLVLGKSLKREEVAEKMEQRFGVKTSVTYWPPCHLQPAYKKKFGYKEGDYPVAEEVLNRTISLPMYCELTDKDIARVVEAVQKTCGVE